MNYATLVVKVALLNDVIQKYCTFIEEKVTDNSIPNLDFVIKKVEVTSDPMNNNALQIEFVAVNDNTRVFVKYVNTEPEVLVSVAVPLETIQKIVAYTDTLISLHFDDKS